VDLGGVTVEAGFTGGHLLHLAAVGYVLDDLYREAATLATSSVSCSRLPGAQQRADTTPGRRQIRASAGRADTNT
jgi:hypothetical protein